MTKIWSQILARGLTCLQGTPELAREFDSNLGKAIKGEQTSLPCGFYSNVVRVPQTKTATRKMQINTGRCQSFKKKQEDAAFFLLFTFI